MKHKYIIAAITALLCIMLIVLLCLLAIPAAAYEGDRITTARQDALHQAAEILRAVGYAEDSEVIRTLQEEWRREQENLDIVARVVMGEAGACPFEHMIAVAAVVVNRVHSPLFPSSVRDVVAQQGQYTTAYLTGFERTNRASYEAAKIALDGTDDVPDDVVWQAEFRQGTEVWWESVVDTGWYKSTTYFCRGGGVMAELKPCPFCGNKYISVVPSVDKRFYWCKCEECEVSTKCFNEKQKAIEFWNRRSDNG